MIVNNFSDISVQKLFDGVEKWTFITGQNSLVLT